MLRFASLKRTLMELSSTLFAMELEVASSPLTTPRTLI
jgi:hypothetical protein